MNTAEYIPDANHSLRIALLGTRGVPASYGGFETAVDEIGRRLAARGHEVTVYCRAAKGAPKPTSYEGMRLVHLPALHKRSLETLSHSALSVVHLLREDPPDVVVVFNAANSVFLPLLRLRRTPAATHVDGLEWQRGKWGRVGKAFDRAAGSLAVRWSDALIADAQGIADYYREEFAADTEQIAYGAPIVRDADQNRLSEVGCLPRKYHLVVARFEPENHVDLIIEGYLRSNASLPLVVVGSSPYASDCNRRISELASRSDRVRLLGGVWDQQLLDILYANSLTYVHGHSVGGTNPSLLRAMGAGAAVIAYDVSFNRDVAGPPSVVFSDADRLADELIRAETDPAACEDRGRKLQLRAESVYTWDGVTDQYERLCVRLAQGASQRGRFTGKRPQRSRGGHEARGPR